MKSPIWEPSEERRKSANMTRFREYVNERFGRNLLSYAELHAWSVANLDDFWATVWDFVDIHSSRRYDTVLTRAEHMMDTRWFQGARLNFAENLLRYRDDRTAIVFRSESGQRAAITYADLYDRVARLARSLREMGIVPGDRVVGFMPSLPETVVAMLAATSIGAVWSSCSPDFGIKGVLDRFRQVEPRVLFTANGYFYNGKAFDSLERVAEILQDLPSVERVVVVPYTEERADISGVANSVHYDDFVSPRDGLEIDFEQLLPDHPLYIMYTSGTTGLPKCMVQGAAGVLINQMKELCLHADVGRGDTIFYFTTAGWMMWNWLVCSLALGATVVLYDGSPFRPGVRALWRMAQDEAVTIFGTSARYLAEIEKRGLKPGSEFDLSRLRTVMSTGSPLAAEGFEYVYQDIKSDVLLASISGGSDINGCFFGGNPAGPVYAGELQCKGLGMDVHAFDPEGNPVIGQKGELVCTSPAPSMPIRFWNDEGGDRYRAAITETGGAIIYGRSDAVLNPGGVRIGTAEIYRQVESLEEVADSVVVGQRWEGDTRIVLFVKLAEGASLTEDLIRKIKDTIRRNATPRHVPARIIAIDDIPYTISMKKVEKAVANVIHGEPVPNLDALANPSSLDLYRDLEDLKA
jgi:acetoacetyl-CoA synthetase